MNYEKRVKRGVRVLREYFGAKFLSKMVSLYDVRDSIDMSHRNKCILAHLFGVEYYKAFKKLLPGPDLYDNAGRWGFNIPKTEFKAIRMDGDITRLPKDMTRLHYERLTEEWKRRVRKIVEKEARNNND